jgi:hypothetical protein
MTEDNSTLLPCLQYSDNTGRPAIHDPHCLDFTGKHPAPVTLFIPPSTLEAIGQAANMNRMALEDFIVTAAWIAARDQLDYDDSRRPEKDKSD